MKIKLNKIMKKGRAMYLAYDQGLEHGPSSDFNDKNVDPLYILDIAKRGGFTGVVFQKGIVEKYNKEIRKSGVPLIMKLNGKTKLVQGVFAACLCHLYDLFDAFLSCFGEFTAEKPAVEHAFC